MHSYFIYLFIFLGVAEVLQPVTEQDIPDQLVERLTEERLIHIYIALLEIF